MTALFSATVRRWAIGLIAAAATLGIAASGAQAAGPGSHSQKEINAAIEKGVAYLDSQQNENGSIGTTAPLSETGIALVAYSVLANGNFESLSATYQAHVKKAIEYLLKEQSTEGFWADSGFYETYSTGLDLAGLSPFTSVIAGVPAAIKKGREFLEGEFQSSPFETCSTEPKEASSEWCGGWNYDKAEDRSDESNTGYALFGLHQSGGVPASIASVDAGWQRNIQEVTSNPYAKRNDGGGCYQPRAEETFAGRGFCSNANNTGTMLFGYGYDGVTTGDAGVKAGIKLGEDILNEYELEKEVKRVMVFHTGEKEDGTCTIGSVGCDWAFDEGEGGYHYSMFSLTKGLGEFIPPNAAEASNWYAKVVDLLLTQQESGGSWPADLRDDASTVFATALSVSSLGLVGVESHISTSLSGEGKTGEKITVKEGTSVTDQATLKGTNIETAGGKVTYKVYSDNECTKLETEAGTVTVSKGAVPPSESKTLPVGTHYWQAIYSGDENHPEASTKCGEEVLTVEKGEGVKSTCGNATIGKTSDPLSAGVKRVNACTLAVNVLVSELVVYLQHTSTKGQQLIKGIVYADSTGKPAALLAVTEQLTFKSTQAAGWYSLKFASPLKLRAGSYWIGTITAQTQAVAAERYNSVKNAEDYNSNTYTSGPSKTFGSFKTTNEQMSLYAVFTPE